MRRLVSLLLAGALSAGASTAMGGSIPPNDLVVVSLSSGSGAVAVSLNYYNVSGATAILDGSIVIPSTGSMALTLPSVSNHDGQLNLSENGQYLVFAGYRQNAGGLDPSTQTAASVPRVIGVVDAAGNINTSTALTDAYDQTSIRSVASVDGKEFWTGGDNGGGNTVTGGTHYVANLGATTSTNISQVQTLTGANTPDNIRGIGVFDNVAGNSTNQLYNSSGSGASVGKSVFQVGTGLPTSGMQLLSPLTNDDSITSFQFVHLAGGSAGYNTLYTSGASGIAKFTWENGTWVLTGSVGIGVTNEDITVSVNGSDATLFVSSNGGIYRYTDTSGFDGTLSGSFGSAYITPEAGGQFRGLSFGPSSAAVPEPSSFVLALAGLGFVGIIRVIRRGA